MTHRQPEDLSSSSPVLLPLLPPLAAASSSSSMSCGLTVMWTTFGESRLNLEPRVRVELSPQSSGQMMGTVRKREDGSTVGKHAK